MIGLDCHIPLVVDGVVGDVFSSLSNGQALELMDGIFGGLCSQTQLVAALLLPVMEIRQGRR